MFQDHADTEKHARRPDKYETQVVPCLLQTADYARSIPSAQVPTLDDENVERRLARGLRRQELLERRPLPILGFILEVAILRRPIGGRDVLKDQLNHLHECALRRNITIRPRPQQTMTARRAGTCVAPLRFGVVPPPCLMTSGAGPGGHDPGPAQRRRGGGPFVWW
ncbi:Scr1 family TA system antitoxin-like transcriptional regulator [Streptomyces longispororuber]|uniref:Scr1 family TA system antitoxin-like transcriptional regulator n=1 Tax=Streptomyces longispororuber TaxID=68230 RepID=UPI0035AB6D47